MIDVSKIEYKLMAITESGSQLDLTDYVESLGWEENDRELAARVSFTVHNAMTGQGQLASLLCIGCPIVVFVNTGGGFNEVLRGTVKKWKPSLSDGDDKLELTCYDELYDLQDSQDNIYFAAGTGTQSAITKICGDWGIPIGSYQGPDVTHEKLVFNSESLSEILLNILDDAKKKGGSECFLRAVSGQVQVLKWGSNPSVYHFGEDNTKLVSHEMDASGMVTRVKVLGQQDDDGRSSVEALVDGQTQFGIRQKIYVRGSDKTLEEAQTAAQEILKEKGEAGESMSIQGPDVPYIRKGDTVHVQAGSMNGFYWVRSVRHDADSLSMTMELRKPDGQQEARKES